MKTDYIDFGFLHCLDEEADLQKVLDSGVLDYIQQLQREGVGAAHRPVLPHAPGGGAGRWTWASWTC